MGVRRGGALLSLIVLPLAIPTLVFGARATDLAIRGEAMDGSLYLLAALAVLALTLAPLAAAAAVRVGGSALPPSASASAGPRPPSTSGPLPNLPPPRAAAPLPSPRPAVEPVVPVSSPRVPNDSLDPL